MTHLCACRDRLSVLAGLTVALALVLASIQGAAAGSTAITERVRAELIADAATVEPGQTIWVGLVLELADGWHTYWRNPGDSGEPTQIDWQLPAGVEAGEIQWPAPERIPYGPLVNFGYHGRVTLLVEVSVLSDWPADRPLELKAAAGWLVCKDICIPEQADLTLSLAAAAGGAGSSAATTSAVAGIADARARLPAPWEGEAQFRARQSADPVRDGTGAETLVLRLMPAAALGEASSAYFFPTTWGAVDPVAPQRLDHDGDGLTLTMAAGSEPPGETLAGVVVANPDLASEASQRRAFAVTATRDDVATATGLTAAGGGIGGGGVGLGAGAAFGAGAGLGDVAPGFVAALALALLGGLLLNVMPCVFPVLSMKAMGVIRHASDRRALRISGLAYMAGILVFVGLVAAVLIGLKAAGDEVGWGFQLQAPTFVASMALVVFALGLSLSGVFTIGASAMGWGGGLRADRSGPLGSFLTGALAALVATPCTAPFMGVALGFALTQPWPAALAVFLALGLGLALPYLVLTLVPGFAGWLPRPGAWMDRIKQLLAFPLYLTAAWLVWVLSLQAGAGAVFAMLVGMILVAFAAWLFEIRHDLEGSRRRVIGVASLAAGLGAFAVATWPQAGAAPLPHAGTADSSGARGGVVSPDQTAALVFEPYSPARLATLRAAGTPAFVNLTAAWCITCQVNERLALSSQRVGEAFRARGIVALKGDWTNRDPDITRLLDSFGRSGVPLYLFYQPGREAPVILPQLLTESIVIDAIANQPLVAGGETAKKGSG